MQLSQERYHTRWLILVSLWAMAAFAIFYQANLTRQYLRHVGELGLRGATVTNTPLREMYPAFAADAQTWVRHALALTEGEQARLRSTSIDNAPHGREVHWNSAWAWTIVGAGWVFHLFTGEQIATSIERAALWLNPCVHLALILILSAWVTKRAGAIAGLIVVAAMIGNDRIYEGFFPAYIDHHGLLSVSVFGMVLGAVMMGAGWWQSNHRESLLLPQSVEVAQRAAAFSALCGACGIWVSAASVIPPIAMTGAAGLLAIFIHGRYAQRQGTSFAPAVWRTWGRVGFVSSLIFYVVEYFPNHLGMRLEPNHPFYALAWLGGGEIIAHVGEWWLKPQRDRRLSWKQILPPVIAVSVAPIAIAIGGVSVFTVIDPFLARLHSDYIQEFLPIWKTIRGTDAKTALQLLLVDNGPLIAGIATLSYLRRESPIVLWFATLVALFLNFAAWWQSRWLLNAAGAQVSLAVVVIACWTSAKSPKFRWSIALLVVGVLFAPSAIMRTVGSFRDVAARRVAPRDAQQALARDIAAKLRSTQPNGDITLLSSPNASTAVGYYGRFKTLGTLYWENLEGLKAAAAIFAARTEEEAAALIRARGVTHIAILSEENFIQQYYELLHPGATLDEVRKSFGARLMVDKVVPQWLEMIPYKLPADLSSLNVAVTLYRVDFEQSVAEAIYHVALAQIESGAVNDADRTLDILLKQAPDAYQPWLRKGELLLARHEWATAAEHLLKGIALAPAAQRPALYINYAKPFYEAKQLPLAVSLYRAALADQPTADAACYLSWILATTTDESLRNDKEALHLAERATKADPTSPSYLNALAAALAANGRFPEAVAAADRALANSRLRGESDTIQQIFLQRLATLKSGKRIHH